MAKVEAEVEEMARANNIFKPKPGQSPEELLKEFDEHFAYKYGAPGFTLLDFYEEGK